MTVPDEYVQDLKSKDIEGIDALSQTISEHSQMLNEHYKQIESYEPARQNLKGHWQPMVEPSTSTLTQWDTGLPLDLLKYIGSNIPLTSLLKFKSK